MLFRKFHVLYFLQNLSPVLLHLKKRLQQFLEISKIYFSYTSLFLIFLVFYRLRRDSEAVSHHSLSVWDDSCSREGRDSVVTTSSGSASSSETLKWHGSMSDVSVSSGLPPGQSGGGGNDRWHHGSMSDVSSLSSGIPPSSLMSCASSSTSSSSKQMLDDYSPTNRMMQMSQGRAEWENSIHGSMSDVSQSNGIQSASKQLIAHSAKVQTPQRHHSESVLYLDQEKNHRKLFPIGTTKLNQEDKPVTRYNTAFF